MKNIVICLIDKMDSHMEEVLNRFDAAGYEMNVFDNIYENKVEPHSVIYILDEFINESYKDNNVFFLTESQQLMEIVYKLYNEIFEGFIYVEGYDLNYVAQSKVYEAVLKDEENFKLLNKSIYLVGEDSSSRKSRYLNERFKSISNVNEVISTEGKILCENKIQKLYYYNGVYYIFSAGTYGGEEIINLCGEKIEKELTIDRIVNLNGIKLENEIKDVLWRISNNKNIFIENDQRIQALLKNIKDNIIGMRYFTQKLYIKLLELQGDLLNDTAKVLVLSFIAIIEKNPRYHNSILRMCLNSSNMDFTEKFFLVYQLIRRGFVNEGAADEETNKLMWKLYRNIVDSAEKQLSTKLKYIKRENRNEDLVILITAQFLSLGHGPTKTILDRCYTLVKTMHKKVLIINTRDLMPILGAVPFFNINSGNVFENYNDINSINYKDISIPFYQSSCQMPNIQEINQILKVIASHKPYFVINIGGNNITADLCSKIVPVMNVSTVMGIPMFLGQFFSVGKKLSDGEKKFADSMGIERERLIEGVFTFDFKSQEHKYARKDLKLPEDKKLLLIVGARLDNEVTQEFIDMLKETFEFGTFIVFAGYFEKYASIVKEDEVLRNNSIYLGFQDDMLAVSELCDIYVNPPRAGGQTSAAEAMSKGVPPVSLNFGDVSVCVEYRFCVNDFEGMKERIKKFIEDKQYYKEMSELAKKRAEVLLDTDTEFVRIIKQMENSRYFK
ncbi:glycosyltransferase [Clostridium oryzae]|uniref:Glycosyl transferase family 1 domain-containing protein n=1 Tax=Clostridium oryzae TaxID=1450648 RepID=A0A1V4IU16_9CLOT|nr:glycosyltransferase [Clostridium oryzae]OPJ63285.1 hypothetical protein CLORY_13680 [Clostridium oryzae]